MARCRRGHRPRSSKARADLRREGGFDRPCACRAASGGPRAGRQRAGGAIHWMAADSPLAPICLTGRFAEKGSRLASVAAMVPIRQRGATRRAPACRGIDSPDERRFAIGADLPDGAIRRKGSRLASVAAMVPIRWRGRHVPGASVPGERFTGWPPIRH